MGKFLRVANTGELSEGTMKKYQVQNTEILVARIGGNYYAVQNKCPHLGGDLSEGILEGTVVTCPRHGSRFNMVDGSVVRWLRGSGLISSIGKTLKAPQKLTVYNIKIENQDLLVEI